MPQSPSETHSVQPVDAPPPAGLPSFGWDRQRGEPVSLWLLAGHLWNVWGIALSNVFLGLMALRSIVKRRELHWDQLRSSILLVPLLLYVICFAASALGSLDPRISLLELREILSLPTLVFTLLLVRGEHNTRRLFDGLVAAITLFAVYGIGQNYLGDYGTLHHRVPGLFSHYQTFAGILLLGALLLVARLTAGNGRHRLWSWIALLLVVWAMLLTLTRGAWVAFMVTLAIYALIRTRRRFGIYLAGAGVALVLFVSFAPDSWSSRMRSIVDVRDSSNYDRLCMADAAFYMISERPLLGIGPEMVRHRYPLYRHPTAPRFNVPHLHNTFLQLASEQGLLSLLTYLWLMLAGLWLAWRGYQKHRGRSPADLHLGVLLAIVGFNLAGLFEDNWRDTEVQRLILFLLAVPVCLGDEGVDSDPEEVGEQAPTAL